ncbi:GNAT family N-acetyltransferase [Bacillus testis]|uniref:GNAT family N-acetyltransferase n=1 Tax=Bacillus testis TaxID=1622072 RepID=UPI00067EF6CB|nr:GNAT family N-acetyltransferase [Bacillus testis]
MKIIPWQEDRLDEITSLWNKEIGNDFPIHQTLLRQNSMLDKNIVREGTLLAINQANEVIGFIVSKIWKEELMAQSEKEHGYIQVLLVHSNYRRKEIGSMLLDRAEAALDRLHIKTIYLGSDPFHYFPGIPTQYSVAQKWFAAKGYTKTEQVADLICSYKPTDELLHPLPKDARLTLLQEGDQESFLHFLNRCFPGRWEYEAKKYFEMGGRGREFVLLKKENQMIGFCRINDKSSPFIAQNVNWSALFNDEETGGIGPLGIDPLERGKGYGLSVVEGGIWFLRQRGISRIIIDWTNLIEFYQKLGYTVWKKYDLFHKVKP